jgi:hypothetical protein
LTELPGSDEDVSACIPTSLDRVCKGERTASQETELFHGLLDRVARGCWLSVLFVSKLEKYYARHRNYKCSDIGTI